MPAPDKMLILHGEWIGIAVGLIKTALVRGRQAPVRIKRPSERRSLSRSATRALDVLEYFGEARRPLRAVEIAHRLGLHPSTANQLLKTMVDSAHLVFDARAKTYLPSPRLAEFSAWVVESYGVGGRLRAMIRDVQARTGMTVTVTTPNDLFMQVIDLALPEGQTTERGLQVSLFGSAIGSAYLASLDQAEIARLADRARIPADQLPAIRESVARIRQAGYADGPSADSAIWSLAIPLPAKRLRVPAVLGLAGPPGLVRDEIGRFVGVMREAIARWMSDSA